MSKKKYGHGVCKHGNSREYICMSCVDDEEGFPAPTCSLASLIEKWERVSKAWMAVARDRIDDAPDMASRAQARAAVYQDCAEELKENAESIHPDK